MSQKTEYEYQTATITLKSRFSVAYYYNNQELTSFRAVSILTK